MIFSKIEMKRYEVELVNGLINSKHNYKKRNGFIVSLYLDDYIGFGEAAPLPFFSKESLREVAWKFEELKASLKCGTFYNKEELFDLFSLITKETPSLNFAVDIALLDAMSKSQNLSLSKYLNSNACDSVSFSAFCSNDKIYNNDIVKVKLGRKNFNDDIIYFENLAKTLDQNTIFRIDLNQFYTLDEVILLADFFENYNIQYIEEPIKDPEISKFEKIKEVTNFSIALDETIISKRYHDFISSGLIDYAVLKAPLFGSMKSIFNFKKYLTVNNVKLILSSSLQTPIGNMSCIHIAAALELKEKHGLNFFNFFNYKNKLPYNNDSDSVSLHNIVGIGVGDETH